MVVCSGEAREQKFRHFDAPNHTGFSLNGEVTTGATIGATIGGLAAIGFGLASGATSPAIAGGGGYCWWQWNGRFHGRVRCPREWKTSFPSFITINSMRATWWSSSKIMARNVNPDWLWRLRSFQKPAV